MKALIVLFVLPTLVGVASKALIQEIQGASLAAAIGAPIVVFACIGMIDPEDGWNWLAALLVSPLVIAVAVITVFLCYRRAHH